MCTLIALNWEPSKLSVLRANSKYVSHLCVISTLMCYQHFYVLSAFLCVISTLMYVLSAFLCVISTFMCTLMCYQHFRVLSALLCVISTSMCY